MIVGLNSGASMNVCIGLSVLCVLIHTGFSL